MVGYYTRDKLQAGFGTHRGRRFAIIDYDYYTDASLVLMEDKNCGCQSFLRLAGFDRLPKRKLPRKIAKAISETEKNGVEKYISFLQIANKEHLRTFKNIIADLTSRPDFSILEFHYQELGILACDSFTLILDEEFELPMAIAIGRLANGVFTNNTLEIVTGQEHHVFDVYVIDVKTEPIILNEDI